MSAFHDVSFPMALSRGAVISLHRASEVVQLASGREVRNARWAGSLRKWNIAGAITSHDRLSELAAFFEARRGNVHAFRFRDGMDFSSGSDAPSDADQLIGSGDGVSVSFQLVKGARVITKPVAGSVSISVGGVSTAAFTVDHLTGVVTLAAAPSIGAQVRAGFLFDVPARFETATLNMSLDAGRAGRMASISLIEVQE